MPRPAAAAALPGLNVAGKWLRILLFTDIQSWHCSPGAESHGLMLLSMAKCGLYSARHALASFISSLDHISFGRFLFGHSMVFDLFHQASAGCADLPSAST